MSIKTGSEFIVEYLIRQGVKYIFGIPGHGCLGFTDALFKHKDEITLVQMKQEMAGVHMAVGYYRVTGQPLAVFTSIGPGAINTAIGLGDAYVDSMPVLVITGDTHVHMRGKGVLQEIERNRDSSMLKVVDALVKRSWHVAQAGQLPAILRRHRATRHRASSRFRQARRRRNYGHPRMTLYRIPRRGLVGPT
ncbi:MAG TPA: thiamine pyrophosphate-binding protein [Candidatus Lokiarchaeia archaeon]|nr:thiamine pyrophosphate-binding protein [Candidatus Lokiarchaeia archaeon]